MWEAAPISSGRWLIRGLPWWTFATEELEFLDHHHGADTRRTGLLAELTAACDKWDRILEDDLAGNEAEHEAAIRIVAIARSLIPTLT